MLRSLVACGWFGIQTWVGGLCILELTAACVQGLHAGVSAVPFLGPVAATMGSGIAAVSALCAHSTGLGISVGQLASFLAFLAWQGVIVVEGMEGVKKMEAVAAPLLIFLCVALLVWAVTSAGQCLHLCSSFCASFFSLGQPRLKVSVCASV